MHNLPLIAKTLSQRQVNMAPSQVQIATSALQRLMKEEKSYYKELEQQQTRISKLEKGEGGDSEGNEEYQLKQEVSRGIRCSR